MLSGMNDAPAPFTPPPSIEPVLPIAVPAGSSQLYQLIQDRLERAGWGDLLAFIRVRREQLKPIPYYLIAVELSTIVDYAVTHESLRRWDRGLGKNRRAAMAAPAQATA